MDTLNALIMDKDYARSIRFRVRERARLAFNLIDPIIALSDIDPLPDELHDAINRARSGNRVSLREIESLVETDLILSDERNSHVAVEISLTADDRDLSRVRERADILGRVTGGRVYAVIAAQVIPEELLEKAGGLDVAVVQLEYRG